MYNAKKFSRGRPGRRSFRPRGRSRRGRSSGRRSSYNRGYLVARGGIRL